MDYIKIEGNSSLVRDSKNNSILNTNMAEYNEYLQRREMQEQENQKIQNIENDLANIRGDIDEIKNLLRSLTNESR